MSDLDLTELRRVAEAATPGPWEAALAHRWDDNHKHENYRSLVYVRGERDPLMPGGGEYGDDGYVESRMRYIRTHVDDLKDERDEAADIESRLAELLDAIRRALEGEG